MQNHYNHQLGWKYINSNPQLVSSNIEIDSRRQTSYQVGIGSKYIRGDLILALQSVHQVIAHTGGI
jgi:hypothetical protein